jgi:F-type H+-transporting ATPase subunit b
MITPMLTGVSSNLHIGFTCFAAAGITEITETFGLKLPHFLAQVLSFCIVAYLLHRLAYKPILNVLEERRRRIAQSLADAEKIKQELAKAQEKAQELVNQAGQRASQLIEEARAAAARVQEEEIQKAVVAGQGIVEKARQAIEVEHARMLAELRHEVGRLVVQTTATVTGKVLTAEDHKRLAEETAKVVTA